MLDVIKAMQTDKGTEAREPPVEAPESRRVPLPPPPAVTQPEGLPGTSETTIYMHAVPSASPSQEVQRGVDLCLDRLVLSGDLAQPANHSPPTDLQAVDNLQCQLLTSNEGASVAGPSHPDHHDEENQRIQQERQVAKGRTEQMVLEAERQKISMECPITGKKNLLSPELARILDQPGSHNLECDDKLYGLSIHLDEATLLLIESGQFIDLSKLLPNDKVVPDDEPECLQLVHQDGKLGIAPQVDKDAVIINSFKRWELAFDVYTGVFARAHPQRGPELFEYKHIIRRASETYIWQNVYSYDKVHRTHMQRNPGRTWSKKHKDAWSDHVKIYRKAALNTTTEGSASNKKRKPCRYFNKNGKCIKGSSCEFDHKCAFCGLFGHGKHNCRKFLASKKETGAPTPQPSASVSSTNAAL